MKALKITGHDNRGGAGNPFGYIYFDRQHTWGRVGYTSSHGVFACGETPSDLKVNEISALVAYAIKHKLASDLMK